jgi:ribonuclease HI
MTPKAPHYLLFSESRYAHDQGQWRFVIQPLDGGDQVEVADAEPDICGERLELLAVVRGLEALDQPSHVTLVTPSKYVNRGLTYGLPEWRSADWQWESFGEMVPVKNRDLWQRVDQALTYHRVECRTWRFDLPHGAASVDTGRSSADHRKTPQRRRTAPPIRIERSSPTRRRRLRRMILHFERAARERWQGLRLRLAQFGTQLLPQPWFD